MAKANIIEGGGIFTHRTSCFGVVQVQVEKKCMCCYLVNIFCGNCLFWKQISPETYISLDHSKK